MRIVVVQNHDRTGVINRFGQPCPEEYDRDAVEGVRAALREGGHETLMCEGDKRLLATLGQLLPPDPRARPSGMVFNMAYGIQGEYRYTHVPAMLEMAGVPYTGSSPLGHGLALDKAVAKRLMRAGGVPSPSFCDMRSGTESIGDLRFPLVVKPCRETMSLGLQLVHEPAHLKQAVERIVTQYGQDALVEEYIDGREIYAALLGNGVPEVLPLVEQDFGERETRLFTWEDKMNMVVAKPQTVCPAQIGSRLAAMVRNISITAFRLCQCQDYARVDLRIDRSGNPFVLEINSLPTLSMGSAYVQAATTAGYSFSSLVNRILDVAQTRYFGIGLPRANRR
ncbi:hypothetical protein X769_32890 [Mesorhizobium sp. LSJC268A00]|uniref:D-alanine--D-alanine ligase family protein n=1 Tax=unclassified Mesorhizobium TaxID=325217 RepID=UPI0003CE1640|nr:ATP-grasp domain-containing protein [Mesorhizobium sp. LSJC268A00]ESW94408.1 hypothetical protein X769_32890 [Mesorhizobium sp. LSJC268A00]